MFFTFPVLSVLHPVYNVQALDIHLAQHRLMICIIAFAIWGFVGWLNHVNFGAEQDIGL
jgi:hypothetical protein